MNMNKPETQGTTQTRGRVVSSEIVTPQPDRDFEALKACCKAIESCTSERMALATLDFLNSKYRPGGV